MRRSRRRRPTTGVEDGGRPGRVGYHKGLPWLGNHTTRHGVVAMLTDEFLDALMSDRLPKGSVRSFWEGKWSAWYDRMVLDFENGELTFFYKDFPVARQSFEGNGSTAKVTLADLYGYIPLEITGK